MKICKALLITDGYQKSVSTWLTVTLKYDNHGGGQSNEIAHLGIIGRVRDRLVRTLSKLDGDQMKSRKETRIRV